ncbi:chorismate mutase [Sansalvadorimonas verongulae]|uniref:chorismate mutase n=1 Tax=Sansalvadorimonas verongulae TaxID=2172824 RepID=UPI0012BB8EA4|nr:chorismate mutase [Sansalvadorimonas verongulae]MTI14219.1 hypothetical protein [Sansalvadorimonas verongulae]
MEVRQPGSHSYDQASQIQLVPTQKQPQGQRFTAEALTRTEAHPPLSAREIHRINLSPNDADAHIQKLLNIVEQRLNLMPEMVCIKRALGDAIYDPDQEKRVLQQAWEIGAKLEISPLLVENFIQQQMEAAKITQRDAAPLPDQETHRNREVLENRKAALRKQIAELMQPMLEAFKPLSESLYLRSVSERVDTLVRASSIQNPEVWEAIKISLSPVN